MSRRIRAFWYCAEPYFGDALNVDLLQKCFGVDLVYSSPETCEACFIGSVLEWFKCKRGNRAGLLDLLKKMRRRPVHVWGSGFIAPCGTIDELVAHDDFIRRMNFHAVRGKLTRARVAGRDVPCGDPGLFAADFVSRVGVEKYALGIVPHMHDVKNCALKADCLIDDLSVLPPGMRELALQTRHSAVIDVRGTPATVIKRISECAAVAASSLHGLIVADSYGIPNARIRSNSVLGGDYKYDDYFSCMASGAFRAVVSAEDCEKGRHVVEGIADSYRVAREDVATVKRSLMERFPFA